MPRRYRNNTTCTIDDVQSTKDCLTSRAGLNLFVRSLRGIDPHLERLFGSILQASQRPPILELFNGTSPPTSDGPRGSCVIAS